MKRFITAILAISILGWTACGNGSAPAEGEEMTEGESAPTLDGYVEMDLSTYGLPLSMMVPGPESGEVEVIENDWGGLEIMVGDHFMVSVASGEGDLELLKMDLQEDLVYTASVLDEGPEFVRYSRVIEGQDMDEEHHFMYIANIDGEVFEVQNMKDVIYDEEAIMKMLEAAKSLKAKTNA